MLGIDYDDLLGAAVGFNGVVGVHGDEYVRCGVCSFGGCDLRIVGCGCTLHARCTHLPESGPMTNCPMCRRPSNELVLLPMSFREIDEARKAALALASNNRGRKRKSMNPDNSELERVAHDLTEKADDRRTGRWTQEEMAYVDAVIEKFEAGQLPLVDGIKLNDFLSNILKSKQSRLTKKMKNAKLSTRAFKRTTGYIVDQNEARKFSDLEDAFYYSIQDQKERAEIKFHMQKEWRDMFSHYCVRIGQTIDVDQWLSSIEELDRRVSMSKDAARRAKRKLMIGNALRQDGLNPDKGVFIDRSDMEVANASNGNGRSSNVAPETEEFLAALSEKAIFDDLISSTTESSNKRRKVVKIPPNPSPFLARALAYLLRYKVPFEHMDAWVPSFVPSQQEGMEDPNKSSSCRLCYAGCATSETHIKGKGQAPVPMTPEEHFNLNAFGDYSQKFSFDIGCGLPGRVYDTGIPSWEQSVHNAPLHHFERCGGALEWKIKTVVGIPIASPTVGRIVILLYSRFDREKDSELVGRLIEEMTKLLPTPAWKLVIDLGNPCNQPQQAPEPETKAVTSSQMGDESADQSKKDPRIDDIISILGEHMPSDTGTNMASYIHGFMTLRLLLLRPQQSWSPQDTEVIRIMVGSYSSYASSGRARKDIALLLARDYMFYTQQRSPPQHASGPAHMTSSNTTSLSAQHSYNMNYDTNVPHTSIYNNTVYPSTNNHTRDNISVIST